MYLAEISLLIVDNANKKNTHTERAKKQGSTFLFN